MKTLSELRALKKAKFLRINHNPKLIESLEDFRIFAESQKKESQKILSVWENKENYYIKFEEEGRIKESAMKKQTENFKALQKNMIVEITFRSKDYFFPMPDGRNCYGDELKKEHLTEKGFDIITFSGDKISYELLKN